VKSGFQYVCDPLFLLATGAYALNQLVLKPRIHSPFLHNHFNDLLLIPAALPMILWVQRVLRLRTNDCAPTWAEMIMHLVVWSVICEYIGPFWLKWGTGDIWDVASYAVGGIAACLWWHLSARRSRTPQP
jgi:hypothetical protein